jgi:hypothetical protein
MKTIRNALAGLLGAGSLMTATGASAQLPAGWTEGLPAWTQTASSCAIDEGSTSKYEFNNAKFRFKGTNISDAASVVSTTAVVGGVSTAPQPIVVRCNVAPLYDYVPAVPAGPNDLFGVPASWKSVSWGTLIVGYQDPDGKGTATQVKAILRKVDRTTLTETSITTFDSNSFSDTALTENYKQFTHTFDFLKYEYYVEIDLVRTKANVATPQAVSVRLTNGAPPVIIR